ncbi:MAG: glycosyltransferase family 4 protein [Thermoplasmata archaeon]
MIIVDLCGPNPLEVESGGVGEVVYNINKLLMRNGIRVINICYSKKSFTKITEIGTVIGIKVPHNEFLKIIIYSIKAAYLSKKFNPDIVQSEGAGSFGAGVTARVLNKHSVKIVERAHGTHIGLIHSIENRTLHMNTLGKLYTKLVERLTFRNADAIIAVSRAAKQELVKYYNINQKDITVIYNGVDTNYYKPIKSKIKVRKELKLNQNARYALFVGFDLYRKGVDKIMNSLNKIKIPSFNLLVIGSKYFNFKNLESSSNEIKFVGKVSDSIKKRYYQAGDIFLFPSRHEGFALAPLEAMSCGLPVIVSKQTGTNEIIKNNINGIILKENTSNDLANSINRVLNNSRLLKKISKNARNTALEYDWNKIVKKYEKFYYSLNDNKQ